MQRAEHEDVADWLVYGVLGISVVFTGYECPLAFAQRSTCWTVVRKYSLLRTELHVRAKVQRV